MGDAANVFVGSLNVVLGALCGYGGAFLQSRLNEKNTKKKLLAEKLETAYGLCQAIYDGHRREMINARQNLPADKDTFLNNRNHPGSDVSRLKMLIRSYAPDLVPHLETLDGGHTPLKNNFIELEKKVLSGHGITEGEIPGLYREWEGYLTVLGQGTNKIKAGIERQLNALAK
ncbi:hypothetical protein KI809_10245 [Geobacter pelophilus]|uniref:Uncharacterized protein n=1 Tax=Geoanaerobacter pelophilus TaxID=60036 RepID=A0AAW4L1E1_9BACT|nr:hypothetical protein [Geoanaerobacter pelophilus]MBT0664678.1 hypothetical protein [Geoanaerobacter pelophilus]